MKKFRELIAELIFDREWKWLEKLISFLCLIELIPKTIHCFAPGKVFRNLRKIPDGIYCYNSKQICPFWGYSKVAKFFYGYQSSGYCHLIGQGDFNSDTLILWDQYKCCNIRDDEFENYGDETECSLEL